MALFNDIHNRAETLAATMKQVQPGDFEATRLLAECSAESQRAIVR